MESHRVCGPGIYTGCPGSSFPSLMCKAERRRLTQLSRMFSTLQYLEPETMINTNKNKILLITVTQLKNPILAYNCYRGTKELRQRAIILVFVLVFKHNKHEKWNPAFTHYWLSEIMQRNKQLEAILGELWQWLNSVCKNKWKQQFNF